MIDPRPTVVPGEPGLLSLQSQLTKAKEFLVDCTSQPANPPLLISLSIKKALSPLHNNKVSIQLSIQSYCFNNQLSSGSQVKTSTYTGEMKKNSCLQKSIPLNYTCTLDIQSRGKRSQRPSLHQQRGTAMPIQAEQKCAHSTFLSLSQTSFFKETHVHFLCSVLLNS